MKEGGINHSDLRAHLHILTVQAMVDRDQLRWAGHVARMPLETSRTFAANFANGTIVVGEFQRKNRGEGGRVTACRKSLPERWATLGLQHGVTPDLLDEEMQDRKGWEATIRRGVCQAVHNDRASSHRAERIENPGLVPATWRRRPSPHQKRKRVAGNRERRAVVRAAAADAAENIEEDEDVHDPDAAGVADHPGAGGGGGVDLGAEDADAEQEPPPPCKKPRQIARAAAGKTHYTGAAQTRVSAAERAQWPWACQHPGCGLRYESERALKIHVTKAGKEEGTHWLLDRDAAAAAEGGDGN